MHGHALIVVGLITLCVGALAYALIYPYLSGDAQAQKRTAALVASSGERGGAGRNSGDLNRRRKLITDSLKELETQNKKKSLTFEQRLAHAGLAVSKEVFFGASLAFGLVLAAGVYVLQEDPLIAGGVGVVGIFGVPMWVLGFLSRRRLAKFLNEFPGAIEVIIRGVKAGLPVGDCFRVVASESPEPIRSEFRKIVESTALGLSIGEATERFAEHVPVPEASFFSIVINLQQRSGGNLSEALSNLSAVLRDRKKMKAKIRAISSEAKSSAGIIGALPFLVGTLLYFVSPAYIMVLFTTTIGKIAIACGLLWMAIGIFIMRKMINFDI